MIDLNRTDRDFLYRSLVISEKKGLVFLMIDIIGLYADLTAALPLLSICHKAQIHPASIPRSHPKSIGDT
jgi:hypothetical protein